MVKAYSSPVLFLFFLCFNLNTYAVSIRGGFECKDSVVFVGENSIDGTSRIKTLKSTLNLGKKQLSALETKLRKERNPTKKSKIRKQIQAAKLLIATLTGSISDIKQCLSGDLLSNSLLDLKGTYNGYYTVYLTGLGTIFNAGYVGNYTFSSSVSPEGNVTVKFLPDSAFNSFAGLSGFIPIEFTYSLKNLSVGVYIESTTNWGTPVIISRTGEKKISYMFQGLSTNPGLFYDVLSYEFQVSDDFNLIDGEVKGFYLPLLALGFHSKISIGR